MQQGRVREEGEACLALAGAVSRKNSARFSAGCFWETSRPSHNAVLELLFADVILACADPSAHGDAGLVDCLRIAGDEWMPPVEIVAVRKAAVCAGGRKPDDPIDVPGGQPDAVLHLRRTVVVAAATASVAVEQPATHIGKIGARGVVRILELDQAAAPAAVAQAFHS